MFSVRYAKPLARLVNNTILVYDYRCGISLDYVYFFNISTYWQHFCIRDFPCPQAVKRPATESAGLYECKQKGNKNRITPVQETQQQRWKQKSEKSFAPKQPLPLLTEWLHQLVTLH